MAPLRVDGPSVAPALPAWLDVQLPFRRSLWRVGTFDMHVMEQGEGRPVLLLHGNPTWGYLWRLVARALVGQPFRLVMPDLIGLGLSTHPTDTSLHTIDFHARHLGALVDALDLRDVVLVAQDWGGAIGAVMSSARPHRIGAAVVLNTVLGPPKPGFRATAFHRFARVPVLSHLVFRGANFPARGMSLVQGDRRLSSDASRAYRWVLRDRRRNGAPLALARMVPDSMQHPSVEPLQRAEAWAQSFRGPTAIVWGNRDPVLGRLLRRTHALLPHAEVTETTAGHFLQEEVPDVIADAIRRVAPQRESHTVAGTNGNASLTKKCSQRE